MAKRLGVQTHTFSGRAGLFSPTLAIMANKLPPTERAKPKPNKKTRAAATAAALKKDDLTDEQVIEMRRLHEEEGLGPKALGERFGVPKWRADQIIYYKTRVFGMP